MDDAQLVQELQRGIHRHVRLVDYQEQHIRALEQQIADMQAESNTDDAMRATVGKEVRATELAEEEERDAGK
jgi:hypothetical protein